MYLFYFTLSGNGLPPDAASHEFPRLGAPQRRGGDGGGEPQAAKVCHGERVHHPGGRHGAGMGAAAKILEQGGFFC